MRRAVFWFVVLGATLTVPLTASLAQCVGDCSDDGEVTVDEIITGVNIALGTSNITQCPVFDRNGDEMVTVDEIIIAVNNALNACPLLQATPTPTVTATPTPMGPDVSPQLLGTFSGPGIDGFTGVIRTVRIRIEVSGGAIVVTDLSGNVFLGVSTITVTALTPTMLSYTSLTSGRAETLQIGPQVTGDPTGAYANITTTVPPTGVSVSFVLTRES